jgi:predicted cupin superfamily sugar epimerase
MLSAQDLIAALQLRPLPLEGGYYRETYRAGREWQTTWLGPPFTSPRPAGTAIYYLLTPGTFSALHRLPSDEVFHFYLGDPIEMLQLNDKGGRVVTLGPDVLGGQQVQAVVPAGVWQGSVLRQGGVFALLGTTMAPGFDFADFEAGGRAELTARFPAFADWIARLTRD